MLLGAAICLLYGAIFGAILGSGDTAAWPREEKLLIAMTSRGARSPFPCG